MLQAAEQVFAHSYGSSHDLIGATTTAVFAAAGLFSKPGGIMKPAAARNRALRCSIHVGLTLIDNGGLVPDRDGW